MSLIYILFFIDMNTVETNDSIGKGQPQLELQTQLQQQQQPQLEPQTQLQQQQQPQLELQTQLQQQQQPQQQPQQQSQPQYQQQQQQYQQQQQQQQWQQQSSMKQQPTFQGNNAQFALIDQNIESFMTGTSDTNPERRKDLIREFIKDKKLFYYFYTPKTKSALIFRDTTYQNGSSDLKKITDKWETLKYWIYLFEGIGQQETDKTKPISFVPYGRGDSILQVTLNPNPISTGDVLFDAYNVPVDIKEGNSYKPRTSKLCRPTIHSINGRISSLSRDSDANIFTTMQQLGYFVPILDINEIDDRTLTRLQNGIAKSSNMFSSASFDNKSAQAVTAVKNSLNDTSSRFGRLGSWFTKKAGRKKQRKNRRTKKQYKKLV